MFYDGKLYDKTIVHNDMVASYIKPFLTADTVALDIGCGTCRKIIPLAGRVKKYYGIDYNNTMIDRALENVQMADTHNIIPILGNNFYLPFENGKFDLVSSMLAMYCFGEVHRVLRTGGILCMELLGVNDKIELKKRFGKDELGWRGILLNRDNETRERYLYSSMSPYFSDIRIQHVTDEITMTYESLLAILEQTPTIRNFCKESDGHILRDIQRICDEEQGMKVQDHRMVVVATKESL